MQAKKERWRQVCEQVLVEQDPIRFQELVNQLNQLLEYKEQRLMHAARPENPLKEKSDTKKFGQQET